jgi:MarR family 2-MHQ and catechol resistance regulon transcriptional repressor
MDTGARIGLILWKAYKAVEAVDRGSVAGTGVGLTDCAVLEVLRHKGPQPVNAIGRKVLLTSGSITSAINRLEHRGLVARRRDVDDARIFWVDLTNTGRGLIESIYARHAANLETVAQALTPEERADLVRLLKKLGRAAQRSAAGNPGT